MSNIRDIVPQVAVSCTGKTVLIELICSDEYAAHVLLDDVVDKMRSDAGLELKLKAGLQLEEGSPI